MRIPRSVLTGSTAAVLASAFASPATAQFAAHKEYGTSAGPRAIALGDLNGDGKLDFAVACFTGSLTQRLSLAPGNAMPGFAAAVAWTLPGPGTACESVAVADVNLDGALDAATASSDGNAVSVHFGDGLGGLTVGAVVERTGLRPVHVAAADVNGDGWPDLVTANRDSNDVAIHGNDGTGHLLAPTFVAVDSGPVDVAVAPLGPGGTGAKRILTANGAGQSVSVLTPDGVGGWAVVNFPTGGYTPVSLAIGDANGDAALDVATANGAALTCSQFVNDGAGALAPPQTLSVAGSPVGAAFHDVNHDGVQDLLTANSTGSSVTAIFGPLGPPPLQSLTVSTGFQPRGLALADLNGDGWIEALTVNGSGNNISVVLGGKPASFGLTSSPAVGASPRAVAAGDLDGNGAADLVTANGDGNQIVVNLQMGGGLFAPAVFHTAAADPSHVKLLDFNGDGRLDVLSISVDGGTVEFRAGLGDGTLAAAVVTPLTGSPTGFDTADLDLDGDPDLAIARGSAGNLFTAAFGAGDGTFSGMTNHSTGTLPLDLDLGDVNGDGRPDAVVTCFFQAGFSVSLATPIGFAAPIHYSSVAFPMGASIGDVNGDGHLDLVSANGEGNSLTVRPNNGSGSFSANSAVVPFPAPGLAVRVQAHDVNGDGKCDLVAVNGVQGAWTFLGNAGSFNTASPLGGAPSASAALAVADLTSDGLPDVVVGNAAAASLEVFVQSPSPTTGISLYGTGTPGCAGALGVGANTTSHVNTPGLAFTCTNAPARALGLGLITNAQDLTGSDPFFLGIFLHVDLFTTTELLALDFVSDPQGNGFVPAPTPNIPALAGLTFYFQGIWIESVPSGQACSPSPFHLTSTRGLAVTVQP